VARLAAESAEIERWASCRISGFRTVRRGAKMPFRLAVIAILSQPIARYEEMLGAQGFLWDWTVFHNPQEIKLERRLCDADDVVVMDCGPRFARPE
jgi:hypothetical protein